MKHTRASHNSSGSISGIQVNSVSRRRGLVLPLVLLVISVIGILAFSLSTVAWRDELAVIQASTAQTISMQADAALVDATARWQADSLWKLDLDSVINDHKHSIHFYDLNLQVKRTHPNILDIAVNLSKQDARRTYPVRRFARRTVWLKPPEVDISAALTAFGKVEAQDPTIISGVDFVGVNSPCGIERDTLSVRSIWARSLSAASGATWNLMPLNAVAPIGDSLNGESALLLAVARNGPTALRDTTPSPLHGIEVSRFWHLVSLEGSRVRLSGVSHFRGLLLVNGDLVVEGELRLEGLLVVRGMLNSQHGKLQITGAAIALNEYSRKPSVPTALPTPAALLGGASVIQYDRCRLQMALATVSSPSSRPYGMWIPAQP